MPVDPQSPRVPLHKRASHRTADADVAGPVADLVAVAAEDVAAVETVVNAGIVVNATFPSSTSV
jgi:hypothetical protein